MFEGMGINMLAKILNYIRMIKRHEWPNSSNI